MKTRLTPAEIDLLQRVEAKPELETFLFKKLKGLKWLDELVARGYFESARMPKPEPGEEPGRFMIRHWPQVGYLLAIAPELKTKSGGKAAVVVRDIIRQVTNYAIQENISNYQIWWPFAKIASQLPSSLIDASDLRLVDYWLNDPFDRNTVAEELGRWILALLRQDSTHARALAHGLGGLLFCLGPDKPEQQEATLRVDGWTGEQLVQSLARMLGAKLGEHGVKIFLLPLSVALGKPGGRRDNWSHIWRPAIEPHEQNLRSETAEQILIDGFRDALDAFAQSNAEHASELVSTILADKLQTPKRIAIYTIAQRFDTLKALVPEVLRKKYLSSNFRHEFWQLLSKHYGEFHPSQRASVLRLIQREVINDEHGQRNAGPTAYRQAGWYAAIQQYGDRESALYRAAVETAGAKPEHADFSSYHFGGPVGHHSLYTVEELLSMRPEMLAEKLRSYVPDDDSFLPEHDARGLGKALQEVFVSDPLTYFAHLNDFASVDLDFIHAIFESFQELWASQQPQSWPRLWESMIAFAELLTAPSSLLWTDDAGSEQAFLKANPRWIVSDIARMIELGTKSDAKVMPDPLLSRAQALLEVMLENVSGSVFEPDTDAVFIAINSARGNCIRALFNLALRRCRMADATEGDHGAAWSQHLQARFNAELEAASTRSFEFIVLSLSYLPNLLYLAPAWVARNLDRLFGAGEELIWLCAMQGYAQLAQIPRSVYDYVKRTGHLLAALDEPRLRERAHEKIVQNIAFGFFADIERLDEPDSLIAKLIARNRRDELGHLIWFFWTLKSGSADDNRLREKMALLWPRLLEVIDLTSRDGRLLASRLCTWIDVINELTPQTLKWIQTVVPYAEENHNAYGVLQSLARLSDSQPREVAEIWKQLLTRSRAEYPNDAIERIFGNLLKLGATGERTSKEIASLYAGKGSDVPLEILNRLRKGLVES
jgi:hypothetical protein